MPPPLFFPIAKGERNSTPHSIQKPKRTARPFVRINSNQIKNWCTNPSKLRLPEELKKQRNAQGNQELDLAERAESRKLYSGALLQIMRISMEQVVE
jgi:hypothetical protein